MLDRYETSKRGYEMRLLAVLAGLLLLVVGLSLIWYTSTQGPQLQDGQAGVAYTELEDGTLVANDGQRPNGRTEIPQRAPKDDGSDEEWLSKFVLTERSGEEIGSEDLKGQPYVAGFFFSTCPSICVQQNSKVAELQKEFQGQGVRFLSISCDPEVDNPEVLTEYAKRFNADADQWLFFTGNMKYIKRVGSEYFSLGVMRRGHPEKFALMDANGKMFGLYTWSDPGQWATLQEDIRRLLEAGGVIEKKSEAPAQEADSSEAEAPEIKGEIDVKGEIDGEAEIGDEAENGTANETAEVE